MIFVYEYCPWMMMQFNVGNKIRSIFYFLYFSQVCLTQKDQMDLPDIYDIFSELFKRSSVRFDLSVHLTLFKGPA